MLDHCWSLLDAVCLAAVVAAAPPNVTACAYLGPAGQGLGHCQRARVNDIPCH